MRWVRRIKDDVTGSALVEAAILTPFLCTLFFGVFEFSYYFYQQHLVATGVTDAARYLAHSCDPTAAGAIANAQNLATTGTIAGGTARRVSGWDPNEVNISFTNVNNSAGTYRGGVIVAGVKVIPVIDVVGSFTYAPLGFWGYFGFSIPAVSITQHERWIGGTLC